MEGQGVAAPMVWQAVSKSAAPDFEGPLPEITEPEASDPAAAEARVGSHSRVRRHGCRQFEFRNEREHEFASGRRVCPHVELPVMVGPVLAMPRVSQHENVGKALRRIDSTTEDASSGDTPGAILERTGDIAIDNVSADEPNHAKVRSNDVVNKTVSAAVLLDLSQRRFAEQSDFELLAKRPGIGIGAQAAHPVVAAFAELDVAVTRVVMNPQVVGDGALDRMAKVVLIVSVAVGPSVHGPDSGKVVRGL